MLNQRATTPIRERTYPAQRMGPKMNRVGGDWIGPEQVQMDIYFNSSEGDGPDRVIGG